MISKVIKAVHALRDAAIFNPPGSGEHNPLKPQSFTPFVHSFHNRLCTVSSSFYILFNRFQKKTNFFKQSALMPQKRSFSSVIPCPNRKVYELPTMNSKLFCKNKPNSTLSGGKEPSMNYQLRTLN